LARDSERTDRSLFVSSNTSKPHLAHVLFDGIVTRAELAAEITRGGESELDRVRVEGRSAVTS
jgi:hypothetical protein